MKNQSKQITISSPEFEIGDSVYYNIPEEGSSRGIVLDCAFFVRENTWQYLVSFGPDLDKYCRPIELSRKKRIV